MIVNALLVLIFTWLIERLAFKSYDPDKRALYVVGLAAVLVFGLTGFSDYDISGRVDYGLWNLIVVSLASVPVFFWRRHGYRKQFSQSDTD